ncbi:MFS transporter [Roseovarius aestuarii]|uniref:Major Facilitator Superfamily protein n=1 Tax=Roseovarius aestuarii TaxID=475083 RepID=A0A1X7BX50_9RHOB|nr:MFS transporter [Roseovarius aestuarii]SMC14070.1 Major Facilitator Superfamily protein [Roseovarius aestuarii]
MTNDDLERWRPWLIVGLSFLALAFSYSVRAVYGLVMPDLEQEFGWSRSFTSGIIAVALLMTAVLAPIGGRLVDQQGARAVILIGLGLLSSGCIVAAISTHPMAFVVAFAGIAGTGFGLLAIHVASTAVEQEFDANQGLATGIASSGSTAGQFVIVPLIAVLLAVFNWRWAFGAIGVSALVLLFFASWWLPKGMRTTPKSDIASGVTPGLWADVIMVLKKPAFHILFWSFFLCGYTTSGVIETHFLPFASICGFSPVSSATAFGTLSALNLVGLICVGWLTDRMNRPFLLGGIYLIRGVTFILLVNVGTDLNALFLFAIIFGLVDYSTSPVTASLVASHIGLRVMGLAFGLISAGHQVGGALGAYFGGILFDIFAQYDWVWWSSVWIAIFAGLLVFLLRENPNNQPTLEAAKPQ